jgi:hypothetical protein
MLVKLAEQSAQSELAQRFSAALADEQQHLSLVKGWYESEMLAQGT